MKAKLILILCLLALLKTGHLQEVTRITKISIEFNLFDTSEYARDTVIYEVLDYPNGSYEKKLIFTTGDSTPFFMAQKVVFDSNEFFNSYSNTSVYSGKLFHEYYYGENQSQKIVKKEDSTIIAVVSFKHKKGNPNKIREAIYSAHGWDPVSVEKIKVKRYLFGIIGLRQWEEYSPRLSESKQTQKEIRVLNKRYYYRPSGNDWNCRSVSKYKKNRLKWEKQKGSESMVENYSYDKSGRIVKKSIWKNNHLIFTEEYEYL